MPIKKSVVRYKVILVGDSYVGKSNILSRYISFNFNENSQSTIGVEFSFRLMTLKPKFTQSGPGTQVKIQVWDTAGQEKFDAMTNMYYRDADAAVLVVDSTLPAEEAFRNSERWIEKVKNKNMGGRSVIVFLAVNKVDLVSERKLSEREIQQFATRIGVPYFETSALSGQNVEVMFKTLVEEIFIYRSREAELKRQGGSSIVSLNNEKRSVRNKKMLSTCCK